MKWISTCYSSRVIHRSKSTCCYALYATQSWQNHQNRSLSKKQLVPRRCDVARNFSWSVFFAMNGMARGYVITKSSFRFLLSSRLHPRPSSGCVTVSGALTLTCPPQGRYGAETVAGALTLSCPPQGRYGAETVAGAVRTPAAAAPLPAELHLRADSRRLSLPPLPYQRLTYSYRRH